MPTRTATSQQIEQLLAEVIAAERAAGMSGAAIAQAKARMELYVVRTLEGVSGDAPPELALLARLAALRIRLAYAENYRAERAADSRVLAKFGTPSCRLIAPVARQQRRRSEPGSR